MPSDVRPLTGSGAGHIDTPTSIALARRAKIVLNIHRDDTPYFEWQRIVWRGLWQRALVVTEPSGPVPGLEAGRDYIEVGVEQMADTLRSLLTTQSGTLHADRVRQNGYTSGLAIAFADTESALLAAVQLVNRSYAYA